MAAISGIINGKVDRHSNGIAFSICNLQNFRYGFSHVHSKIMGKNLAQKNGIFGLEYMEKALN
jgi:hypothetical protein